MSEWFNDFNLSEQIKVPSLKDFYILDNQTNIKLIGIPDEMFLRTDESYFIADYKTARFTSHQDELIPMYEVQLNGTIALKILDIGRLPDWDLNIMNLLLILRRS